MFLSSDHLQHPQSFHKKAVSVRKTNWSTFAAVAPALAFEFFSEVIRIEMAIQRWVLLSCAAALIENSQNKNDEWEHNIFLQLIAGLKCRAADEAGFTFFNYGGKTYVFIPEIVFTDCQEIPSVSRSRTWRFLLTNSSTCSNHSTKTGSLRLICMIFKLDYCLNIFNI